MLEALLQGAAALFQPVVLLGIFIGTVFGIVIGVIPAIGGMVACALFLPFVYQLPPDLALSFLVALISVVYTGGSITSILLGVPGTAPNAATIIDGFPMAQKGEAGRAVGAAVVSSMFGGIASVFFALGMIPLVRPIVLTFRAPEMFMVVLLGLSFLAIISAGSAIKGMISGLLGILFALIGFQGLTGVYRFTFGSIFLSDGIDVIAVALGLFALAEMFDMIVSGKTAIAKRESKVGMQQIFQGVKDVYNYKWLWLRSSLIGYIIGVIPGVGGDAAMFIAYGHAKHTSKNSDKFGTGCVEGVIGPESANNAKEAGALLTTMFFGIPGSAVMAILLGGFLLVGVTPGPVMIKDNLPLVFTLLIGIAVANGIAGIICLLVSPQLIRVSSIHIDYLFVVVPVLVFIGAFVTEVDVLNFVVAIFFGILGFLMKKFGYSRAALVLGFVLGEMFEFYLARSLKIFGLTFFLTPACLVMIAIIIGVFSYPWLKEIIGRRFQKEIKKT
jgi:putative tricarboxylic transport membrane protein